MKSSFLIPIDLILIACNSMQETSKSKTSLFTKLQSSAYQGRAEASNLIINNQAELNAIYQSVNQEVIPSVDFNNNQVVAVFIGTKNTGGYQVVINKVIEEQGKVLIFTKVEEPAPGAMVTMAITNPYIIAEIHSKKEIVFK